MIKNYGFNPSVIDETQYKSFGALISLPYTVVLPDGNWEKYLPKYERQFGTDWDSYGCTVFGTLNCLETILKQKYGKEYDFSERYIYNIANVQPPGHDPHDIAEKIRKEGVLSQGFLPYIDSFEEFKKPRPMTKELIDRGHLWLSQYDFKHEWVFDNDLKDINQRHKLIRHFLKAGPLGISVTAWQLNEFGEYESNGQKNTHWCEAFYIDEKDRVYVFDSYDQEIKILSTYHDIQFCKRYIIIEKTLQKQYENIIYRFLGILSSYLKGIKGNFGSFVADIFSEKN